MTAIQRLQFNSPLLAHPSQDDPLAASTTTAPYRVVSVAMRRLEPYGTRSGVYSPCIGQRYPARTVEHTTLSITD
jgi:hypothetical protein